jgi:hypothetical protein
MYLLISPNLLISPTPYQTPGTVSLINGGNKTTGGRKPMREDGRAAFARCPHCAERPAAGHHLCPLNLEADGCECCGACWDCQDLV